MITPTYYIIIYYVPVILSKIQDRVYPPTERVELYLPLHRVKPIVVKRRNAITTRSLAGCIFRHRGRDCVLVTRFIRSRFNLTVNIYINNLCVDTFSIVTDGSFACVSGSEFVVHLRTFFYSDYVRFLQLSVIGESNRLPVGGYSQKLSKHILHARDRLLCIGTSDVNNFRRDFDCFFAFVWRRGSD